MVHLDLSPQYGTLFVGLILFGIACVGGALFWLNRQVYVPQYSEVPVRVLKPVTVEHKGFHTYACVYRCPKETGTCPNKVQPSNYR